MCFREAPGHSWGPARTSLGKAHPQALSPTSEAQRAAVTQATFCCCAGSKGNQYHECQTQRLFNCSHCQDRWPFCLPPVPPSDLPDFPVSTRRESCLLRPTTLLTGTFILVRLESLEFLRLAPISCSPAVFISQLPTCTQARATAHCPCPTLQGLLHPGRADRAHSSTALGAGGGSAPEHLLFLPRLQA